MSTSKEDLLTIAANRGNTSASLSPKQREAEREEIARQMAEYEAKHGPIQTIGCTTSYQPKKTFSLTRTRWTD